MKKRISDKTIITVLIALLVSFLVMFAFFSTKYKDVAISEWLIGTEARESEVIREIEPKKSVSQPYEFKEALDMKEITLYMDEPYAGEIKVSFLRDDETKKEEQVITLNGENDTITINLPEEETYIGRGYKLKITNRTDSVIGFYADEGKDNKAGGLITSFVGSSRYYHNNYLILLTFAIFAVSIILIYYANFKNKKNYEKIKTTIFDKLKKYKLLYVVEVVLFFIVILSLMSSIVNFYYLKNLVLWNAYLFIFTLIIFFWYFMNLIKLAGKDLAKIFITIGIPLLITYLFLMVPNSSPDEYQHLSKTYLTSTFDFSKNNIVELPDSYAFSLRYNYYDFYKLLFSHTDYSSTIVSDLAVGRHFINYLLPSIGIIFARLFNLSFMFGVISAKFINSMVFLVSGYYIIKKVPVGKIVFFTYLLTPMVLQQSNALGVDVYLHMASIGAIAYFLYLKFSDENIKNRDIIFLSFLFLIVGLTKYAYLPLFGLVFLLFDKLKKMTKKQWIIFISLVLAATAFILYYTFIIKSTQGSTYTEYYDRMSVDSGGQLKLILQNPLRLFQVFDHTLAVFGEYYTHTFIGSLLSGLVLRISWLIVNIFIALILISPFLKEEKKRFKLPEKLWMVAIVLIIFFFIELGLYLEWSTMGSNLILGVQGRYFIPIFILILLAFTGKKRISIKNYERKYTIIILILHFFVLKTVFEFFVYAIQSSIL